MLRASKSSLARAGFRRRRNCKSAARRKASAESKRASQSAKAHRRRQKQFQVDNRASKNNRRPSDTSLSTIRADDARLLFREDLPFRGRPSSASVLFFRH